MRDMTDNEIIKALGNCVRDCPSCTTCPYDEGTFTPHECMSMLMNDSFDLINRQKAEIESLKHRKTELQIRNQELQHEKSEAIKEFAEKLKNCFAISGDYLDIINIIDNLVKEMMEVEE